jgi:DNA topoisomerase-1
MSKNLVIVESPAKGKTIEKYLGKDYQVLASYGHVRDLIPKEGAVDPEHGYAMKYDVIDRNEKHVKKIAQSLKKADTLFLATDPDREGEAISWHLYELLKERGSLEGKEVQRVVFHEITKSAVQNAIANPRGLATPLIDAQQARRALDYLVGFNLSPLLWRKIKPSLSAGRVQSPALRMIVEREDEIEKFIPQEYWTLIAQTEKDKQAFTARLHTLNGKKLDQFDINTEALATDAKSKLLADANGELKVTRVEKKQRKRNPAAPFTTSTLQQEAARKLRFSTRRTMQVAQQLYEGIDFGSGPTGLITYMRTDSVTLANEAIAEIRDLIGNHYQADDLPSSPRMFQNKSKNAQEAHEAIRPTSVKNLPDKIRSSLTDDQYKLYDLIWKRTVASQMIHATMDTVSADLSASEGNFFRASGSSIRYPGFLKVYNEGLDDNAKDDTKEKILPPLNEGDVVDLHDIEANQHFTEPPPRYTEASLVKALEEHGIGRPSTYASIISTLQSREYVELESRRFFPTDIGKIVGKFLTEHFTQYVDYDFTARMEDELDEISRGEKEWVPVLDKFWHPFHDLVGEKDKSVTREQVMQARELGTDPKTGKPISVRMGRYGPFVQIGTKDDEEKPQFASLRPGQKMDDVTLEDAFELFKLPRDLGVSPEGEKISTNIGRFGPYVKYDSKYVSLKKEDDPYTITLERALELVAEKKEIEANRIIQDFADEGIQVLNGRWGPYVTDGNKNAKVPKETDPKTLTLDDCQEMIAKAPEKKGRKKAPAKKAATKKTTTAKKTATKKTPAKAKTTTRKTAAKKTTAKATTTRKTATKKTPAKASTASAKKPASTKTADGE